MITNNSNFFKDLLQSVDYEHYSKEILMNSLLDEIINNPNQSIQYKEANQKVRNEPIKAEVGDLARIMHITKELKIKTILEFGSGKSTNCLAYQLNENKKKYENIVAGSLRTGQAWKLFSIETSPVWLENTKSQIKPEFKNIIEFSLCSVVMSTFNDLICTYYQDLPNCRPDLIYLDGPDQFDPNNHIRGISTNHEDRMPMSADILSIEYFLEPGCIIIVDGRSANAMMLLNNLQRNWHYEYFKDYDQHFFLLNEAPLGVFNEKGINFHFGGIGNQKLT